MTTEVGPGLVKIECSNEKDWLHERDQFACGGSDAYDLLTHPLRHYARKKGLLPPFEGNERTKWGKRLQGSIGLGFGEDTGRTVTPAPEFTIYRHPEYPMVGVTLDFFEHDADKGDGILETKNTDIEWVDDPPAMYQVQLQVQLSCLRLPYGTLAALHRGNRLIWADLMRHEEFIKRFLSKAEEMSWRLATNNPPAVDADGSEDAGKALAALFPKDTGASIALPPEALQWTDELEVLKNQKRAIEEQITLRESWIKEQIKDATYGVLVDGRRWQWKEQTRVTPPRLEPQISTFRAMRLLKGSR